jgi:hypothetical protein
VHAFQINPIFLKSLNDGGAAGICRITAGPFQRTLRTRASREPALFFKNKFVFRLMYLSAAIRDPVLTYLYHHSFSKL